MASQKLGPIDTASRIVEQGPLRFAVRVVTSLERKRAARSEQGAGSDPFEVPEADLVVEECRLPKHVALLNKFPVLDRHVLLVTRQMEQQSDPLGADDFQALAEIARHTSDAWLAFYNCGDESGRSQPHKHLQLVPYPFEPQASQVEQVVWEEMPFVCQSSPIESWVHWQQNLDLYRAMLDRLGPAMAKSHNVVLSPNRLVVVPRRMESFEAISVNSLGFCFSLFASNDQGVALIEQAGPLNILTAVGYAKTE